MKKIILLPIFIVFFSGFSFAGDLFLIDEIESVIYGPKEISIVTKSDINRQALDGSVRTKDSVIFEQLIVQDGKRYNFVDEKMIDRYIATIQRENNLSLDDLKSMFRAAGYTYEEGREQLSIMNTVNSMIDYKVRSKLIIPEKDVQEYYDANPVYLEESYQLLRIVVPCLADEDREKLRHDIENKMKIGQKIINAEYHDPFWINKSDISADKKFITNIKIGQMSLPIEYTNGFEIFKLIDKKDRRLVPIEDRYKDIADELRKPLYEKIFSEYKKSLYDGSVIVDLN